MSKINLKSIVSIIFPFLIQKALRTNNIYYTLCRASLIISSTAFIGGETIKEYIIKSLLDYSLESRVNILPSYIIGFIFIFLTFVFAYLGIKKERNIITNEKYNHGKKIKYIASNNNNEIFIFNGSIFNIDNEVELIVSSENNELNLGNISGNSISGRLRNMAAIFDKNDIILEDPISKFITNWKKKIHPRIN